MSPRPGSAEPRPVGRGIGHRRRLAVRLARRRRLGAGLLGFGVAGLIVLAGTAAVIIGTLGPIEAAAREVERQRVELIGLLDGASTALRQTATGAENATTSLRESAAAAREGAALTTDLASAFDQLAVVSEVSIFGTQPFGDLGAEFSRVAGRARTLSANLDDTAEALTANEADAAASAEDLEALAARLETLREGLTSDDDAAPGTGGGAGTGTADLEARAEAFEAIAFVRIVLLGLLAWLAVPAVAAVWIGWRWIGWRWRAPVVEDRN